jgi:hypothetical protein
MLGGGKMSQEHSVIHYRRCHVCGGVTEQKERIEHCEHCGKSIVPFLYYDDSQVEALDENRLRPTFKKGQLRPIFGLTAYWQ